MNQGEEANAAKQQREITGTEITKELLLALLPTSMGLMLARTGMIVGAYGSYMGTDAGIYTDGASFISLVPLLLLMVALGLTDKIIPKRAIFHSTNLCIALEAIGIAAVALIEAHAPGFTVARMAASTLVTASAWICMFYWLRRCRGASCTTAIIIVLGAMIASETILYVFSFIPRMVHCLIFAMAVLAQYAAIAVARRNPLPAEIDTRGYFHFAQKNADSVRFLGIIAIESFLMSIAIGFLKGFPNGDAIPFTHVTRLLYALLIDGVFIGLLWGTIKGKKSTMTIGTWVVMQGLGSIALLLFALFPERLDIGAVFGNAMNVTMTGFISLSDHRVFQLWTPRRVLLCNRRLGCFHFSAFARARDEHRTLRPVPLNLAADGAVRRIAAYFRPAHFPSIPYARTRRNRRNQSDCGKRAATARH